MGAGVVESLKYSRPAASDSRGLGWGLDGGRRGSRGRRVCVAVATKNVAFFRGETEGSEHRGPAVPGDDINSPTTVGSDISVAIEEEEDNLIGT